MVTENYLCNTIYILGQVSIHQMCCNIVREFRQNAQEIFSSLIGTYNSGMVFSFAGSLF